MVGLLHGWYTVQRSKETSKEKQTKVKVSLMTSFLLCVVAENQFTDSPQSRGHGHEFNQRGPIKECFFLLYILFLFFD
jgi:hypothetical protein